MIFKRITVWVIRIISEKSYVASIILNLLPKKRYIQIKDYNNNKKNYHLIFEKLARYNKSKQVISREINYLFVNEFKMILNINEFTQCGYYFRVPNPELISLIRKGGDGFVDIGANVGIFSMIASQTFNRVYAFEPFEHTCNYLKNNAKINSSNNITVYNMAISDAKGRAQLYCNPFNNGGHSLEKLKTTSIENKQHDMKHRDMSQQKYLKEKAGIIENGSRITNVVNVRKEMLDDILGNEEIKVDLIKIDVEGHELSVIRGAKKIIHSHKPFIFAEVSKNRQKVIKIINLLPHGYIPYSLIDNCYINKKTSIPDDVLFVPEEKINVITS